MRLYITVWQDEEGGTSYKFTGTQADQRSTKKAAEADDFKVVRNEEVEVPTVKEKLIEFLNKFKVMP